MLAEKDFSKVKVTTKKGERPNKPFVTERGLWSILIVIGVVLFSILVVAILVPANFVQYLYLLFLTPINSFANFGDFLGQLAWLIIIGLSLMVSFRVGVFNIGACAQFLGGAMVGYTVALSFNPAFNSDWIGIPLVLLTATITGAFIGWIIAKFKTIFGIHEVLTSIMFNWIALYLVLYLTTGAVPFFTGSDSVADSVLNNSLRWEAANEFLGSTYFNYGVLIAIVLIFVFWFLYKKTIWGYKQDILGSNINVGDYTGINKNKEWERSIAISGGLAGLAGVIYYISILGNVSIPVLNDLPTQAFLGITIALLGFCNPIGIVFAAILIAYLTTSLEMIYGLLDIDIVTFIMAMLILIIAMFNYFIVVRPQEKWFKKDIDAIPWEDYELDVIHMSKYITIIQDNLSYSNYDINEGRAYLKYYDKEINSLNNDYINKLENTFYDKKQLKSLELKKDQKIKKLEEKKNKQEIKIEILSQKLIENNEKLFKKHQQFIWNEEEKKVSKLTEKIEKLKNNRINWKNQIENLIQEIGIKKEQLKLEEKEQMEENVSKLILEIEKLENRKHNKEVEYENILQEILERKEKLISEHQPFFIEREVRNISLLTKEIENIEKEIVLEKKESENISRELIEKKEKLSSEQQQKDIDKIVKEIKKVEIRKEKQEIQIKNVSKKLIEKNQQLIEEKQKQEENSKLIKEKE